VANAAAGEEEMHRSRSGVSAAAMACAAGLFGGGYATTAQAQTVAPDHGVLVGELVVTARKREERLRDVPTAATVLDVEHLRDIGGLTGAQSLVSNVPGANFANTSNPVTSEVSIRGSGTSRATAATVLDVEHLRDIGGLTGAQSLLSNVPGANFANTSNPVTSEVSIRGTGTSRATAAESGVGLYRNGVYIGGGYQGGRTFSSADYFDPQRVEVLRGVQGALNGRNAVGGSVNIVSARPVQGRQTGFATAKVGNNEHYEGQLVVNQPLGEGLALRLGVDLMDQDKGDFYNPVINQYFDKQKSEIYRAQVAYENGPLSVNLLAEHGADLLPGLMYAIYIRPGTNAIYPYGVADDKYNMHWSMPNTAKMRTNYFEVVANYDLGFATVTATSALRERHSQNAFDRDGTSAAFEAEVEAAGLVAPGRSQSDPNLGGLSLDFSRILYNDLHIAGVGGGRWSWLAGAEYYDLNDTAQLIATKTPMGATAAGRSPGTEQIARIDFTSWAIYGSLGYDLTEALNLTVEGRYTKDDKSIDSQRLDLGTGLPSGVGFAFTDGRVSDNLSYTATLAYKVAGWLTYAKVGTAYRAGGFNLGLGDPRAPKEIPATFGDEDSTSYEVGLKGNLTPNIYINAAAYRTYVDDLLVQTDNGCFIGSTVCPTQRTNYIYNAGKAKLTGLEAEATGRANILGGTARLTLGVSRQWGKITSGPDKGRKGPQRPDWTATMNLNYRHGLGQGYTGFVDIKGDLRSGGVQEIEQTPKLHDFQVFDLRMGVDKDNWQAAIYVNNFANESYIVYDSASARRWNFPQTYGAELTYRW
jgi:iron complex outermembrane receptor protein